MADLPIRGIFEEWEREETARREQSERLKALFKRAKDDGYNPKAMRLAFAEQYAVDHFPAAKVAERSSDAADVDLYLAALAGVRAREIIEEFGADADGVVDHNPPRATAADTSEPGTSDAQTAGAARSSSEAAPAVNFTPNDRHDADIEEVPPRDGASSSKIPVTDFVVFFDADADARCRKPDVCGSRHGVCEPCREAWEAEHSQKAAAE